VLKLIGGRIRIYNLQYKSLIVSEAVPIIYMLLV